jgi:hypothetical protein
LLGGGKCDGRGVIYSECDFRVAEVDSLRLGLECGSGG